MKFTKKLLEYFGVNDAEDQVDQEDDIAIIDLAEMEIEAVIQELASEHADTDKYTTEVNNLKTLTEAYEKIAKAEAEQKKAEAEVAQSKAKKQVDWGFVAPKVAGIVVYGGVMVLFMAMERENPLGLKIVQTANTLLNPKI